MANTSTESDLEPLLNNQQNQLGLVFGDSDSIDGKALAVLGANIAIVIFINQTATGLALWEYIVLYGPFVLSLILDVLSIWPRDYKGPGVNPEQLPDYMNMPKEQLLLQLLSDTQAAITYNSTINKWRLSFCTWSIVVTGLGFAVLLVIL